MISAISNPLMAFTATVLVIEITPGPNMAYLAALSLSNGRRAGFAAVAGIALGLAVCGIAAAFGLAAIIDRSPLLYESLRWGGVAYLLYLAWEGWKQEPQPGVSAAETVALPGTAFWRGLIVNILNPKAALFYVAVLPEFVRPDAGSLTAQTLTLSGIYVSIATAIHLLIVLLASSLQGLVASPEQRLTLRRVLAVALLGIAIWLAVGTRRA